MRLCSGIGCGRAIPEDTRFCAECISERGSKTPLVDATRQHNATNTGAYDAELDKLRTNSRWQRVRDIAIKRHPLCQRCDLRLSEIVDHIIPAQVAIAQARASGRFPFDKYAGYFLMSNLQGLCRPCHGKKTVEDKAHICEWPDVMVQADAQPKKRWTF
jgi:5-methylcytosine-specific restriction endonuclease McrA